MPRVEVELHGVAAWLIGARRLIVEASTVGEALRRIAEQFPRAGRRLLRCGEPAPDLVILVNDVDVRLLRGLDTELRNGDRLVVITYIHGG